MFRVGLGGSLGSGDRCQEIAGSSFSKPTWWGIRGGHPKNPEIRNPISNLICVYVNMP